MRTEITQIITLDSAALYTHTLLDIDNDQSLCLNIYIQRLQTTTARTAQLNWYKTNTQGIKVGQESLKAQVVKLVLALSINYVL